MDKSNIESKLALIDAEFPSPEIRAARLYQLLKPILDNQTDWDILCFNVQYIGWISQRFPFIEDLTKQLNRLLYTAHYYDRDSDVDKRTNGSRSQSVTGVEVEESNRSYDKDF